MPFLDVYSDTEIRRLAFKLRKAEAKDLREELRKGQRAAFRPLQAKVKASAAAMLPKRGGYAGVMARSVKVSILTQVSGDVVIVAHVFARGRREHRDVAAVNAGRLRHPLFGRRLHWFTTTVKPHFVDLAIRDLPDEVLKHSAAAAERVLQQIARG